MQQIDKLQFWQYQNLKAAKRKYHNCEGHSSTDLLN